MASDIESKLSRLRTRRKGESGTAVLSKSESPYIGYTQDAAEIEDWETRGASNLRWTRYAFGAMQAVSDKYTQISIDTGLRVANQLRSRLSAARIPAEFQMQGSVPLNVHIRRVSDVDVLAIRTDFLTYYTNGPRSGSYYPSPLTSQGCLRQLRLQVESDLEDAYPSAIVDKSKGKAVNVSGGSLPRSVDVVPAHWHDTYAYQLSGRQADRAITIFNKNTGETLQNLPFLHIDKVGTRCDEIGGGLRKAIRLCKNVKADSDRDIQLSSYDIAAIMYHADMGALAAGRFSDLAVLAETQRHLDYLCRNFKQAELLVVPDGTRTIFDAPEKEEWLARLSMEIEELFRRVFEENYPQLHHNDYPAPLRREFMKMLDL